MPDGDRTGRMGKGPLTGRGAGFCRGNDLPGYANRGGCQNGRGQGRRRGPDTPPSTPDHQMTTRERLEHRAEVLRAELDRIDRQLTNLGTDRRD